MELFCLTMSRSWLKLIQLAPDVEHGSSNGVRCKIDWSAQSKNVLYEYGVQTYYLLRDVEIPTDVLLCKDCNCTSVALA